MENNHDIDKKFNEASKDLDEPATFPGFDKVWAKVEEKLDTKEKKKRMIPIWLPYGIAASLMIGVGGFFFFNEKDNTAEPAKSVMAKNTVAPNHTIAQPTEKIQKIDQIVKSNIEKEILAPPPVVKVQDYAVNSTYISSSSPVYDAIPQSMPSPPSIASYKADTLKQKNIDEVVVTGLGTKRLKKDMTSSVQTISSSEVENKSNNPMISSLQETAEAEPITPYDGLNPTVLAYNNVKQKAAWAPMPTEKVGSNYVAKSLQGKVSGLTINMGSGNIDYNNAIVIRGATSLKENSNPLYVINGVVSDVTKFKNLDQNTIEAVTVLKGEKATAMYGSKAVNGVIVVETKAASKIEKVEKKGKEQQKK